MIYNTFLTLLISWLLLLSGQIYGQTLDDARAAIRIRDYESAVDTYTSLARSGDPEAAYQLASMYRMGRGVERREFGRAASRAVKS